MKSPRRLILTPLIASVMVTGALAPIHESRGGVFGRCLQKITELLNPLPPEKVPSRRRGDPYEQGPEFGAVDASGGLERAVAERSPYTHDTPQATSALKKKVIARGLPDLDYSYELLSQLDFAYSHAPQHFAYFLKAVSGLDPQGQKKLVNAFNTLTQRRQRLDTSSGKPTFMDNRFFPDSYAPVLYDVFDAMSLHPEATPLATMEGYVHDLQRRLRGDIDELVRRKSEVPVGSVVELNENSVALIEKAQTILRNNPTLEEISDPEKKVIQNLIELWKRAAADAYSGDNQFLRQVRHNESDATDIYTTSENAPISSFIENERFRDFRWWISGNDPLGLTNITAETSKSPLLGLHGPGATRTPYWPMPINQPTGSGPDLSRLRIIVNQDAGKVDRSIELWAKDGEGNWQPAIYKKISNTWLPQKKINGKVVKAFCMQCHTGANGMATPRPTRPSTHQPFTHEDFKAVGYKNDQLIDQMTHY